MSYKLGIDVGSTTLKIILLDSKNRIIHKSYERHFSKVRELLFIRMNEISEVLKNKDLKVSITGSAGMGIAEASKIPFVQEVFAISNLIKTQYKDIDVAIELGGEDAKIIFFGNTIEERMNGTCAGGTGSFIDQMATLLNVSTPDLDSLSLKATDIYPIASRCGVFAKTDIQPLINQGASKENIAASIFQAVVDQTITGLAQGHQIKGKVLFLGGPLTFLKGLQKAFTNTLKLSEGDAVFPENAEYFVAYGCAVYSGGLQKTFTYNEIMNLLLTSKTQENISSIEPLFKDEDEYIDFKNRHQKSCTEKATPPFKGNTFLGIDSGSTTTKLVLIDDECKIIYKFYGLSKGNPLDIIKEQLIKIYEKYPDIVISHSAVTGYGEDLVKAAFKVDIGTVETVAHFTAAKYFNPDVDFIIDIGGQDMKCFGIKNNTVDSVALNEACSSGCGSFLETFAFSLGYPIEEFSKLGLFAKRPVDLGTRCTVFMNSSVKQAQKNGASIEDISAGLSISVVKNAIYKVLRVTDAKQLGNNIVVQGGTFLNDAVLRSFEKLLENEVTRPDIAGLMGAFGCALIAKHKFDGQTTLLDKDEIKCFKHSSKFVRCGLCTNRCSLTINSFNGNRKMISGNRCERPLKNGKSKKLPNVYEFKRQYLYKFSSCEGSRGTIGLPMALNFYDTLPFWFTLFKQLGFSVKVSGKSNRNMYRKAQHTIPSDTVCYGAKLVHGHILNLIENDVDAIFYPCMSYNIDEGISDNCYHCPVVAYYPEVIKNNVKEINKVKFIYPYLTLNNEKNLAKNLYESLLEVDKTIIKKDVMSAIKVAFKELKKYKQEVLAEGSRVLQYAKQNGLNIIVLAGRPYHIDSEINHGIDTLISSLGFVVISEDSIPFSKRTNRRVLNQWTYHARMYNAAEYVANHRNIELVQLVSFGCGLDAVTSDEIKEELIKSGKLYTQLKIDEINNLGAVKIRMRSLLAAMEERKK